MKRPTRKAMNYYTSADKPFPVVSFTEAQLHRMLVTDAVNRHETDPIWFAAACVRIGKLNRRGAEAAFQAVLAEVEELTGMRIMPGAPGFVG